MGMEALDLAKQICEAPRVTEEGDDLNQTVCETSSSNNPDIPYPAREEPRELALEVILDPCRVHNIHNVYMQPTYETHQQSHKQTQKGEPPECRCAGERRPKGFNNLLVC